MTHVAGLVLAAGEGRRFGAPKALVELDGERLVDRAVRVLREGGCDPVYVVSGAVNVDVPGATAVVNGQWQTGMASSLRAGLEALPDAADAVVISLVDQPGIGADVVGRLVRRLDEGHQLVVATYDGNPRNPVGVARPLWPAVCAAAVDDEGARAFIRGHPDLVDAVECADIGDPTDIDTPADLASPHREET
ncbi:MAG: nucleotidyltransferase family protein [Sporichthyaceae bacterium]